VATAPNAPASPLSPLSDSRLARVRRAGAGQGWILRRLGLGVVTMAVVSVIIFLATQVLPGDPARKILGPDSGEAQIEALRDRLGLDDPLLTQFANWAGGALTGDFGESYLGRPVGAMVGQALANTLSLVSIVIVLAVILSLFIGVRAASRRDGPFDHAVVFVSLVLTAIPDFVIAIGLVLLFATAVLQVLPAVAMLPEGASAFTQPKAIALPVITLTLGVVAYLSRHIRASMIDVLESDYIQMARNKGLRPRTILWRHALPNAITPTIQAVAFALAHLIAGVITVEFVYGYPGVGTLFVNAVGSRDLPVIQGLALVFAATWVILNLVVDILTVYVDPRLRTSARRGAGVAR